MNNKLSYFVSKSSMFGIGYFLLLNINNKNAYLSIILGTILGIGIIYLYSLIRNNIKNKNLVKALKSSFIGNIYNILLILFYLYLLCITILIFTTFINSFYLIKTPKLFIIIPFILLSLYLSFKEKRVLTDLSVLMFYFSLLIVFIFSLLLIPYNEFSNIMPILNYNTNNILIGSLIYACITSIPLILTINYDNNFKNTLKNYLIASLLNLLIILGCTLSLGNLINIYRFPEYAVLKQIRLLDFIENIENISTFGWYAESFVFISLIIANIKESLPRKYNKFSLPILTLLSVIFASIIIGNNYELLLKLFYLHPVILSIFLFIFISMFIYVKFKNRFFN